MAMDSAGSEPLTSEQVRHIARLARLRPTDADIERYRHELSDVLKYVAILSEVDVSGVEPLSHPLDLHTRLDRDDPVAGLPREALSRMAPQMEGPFVAVPKTLDDGGG
jgi:aspartyl-tRNA(Asn)/glutamyl-tRNA(Gln) amidotransferase subunit C